MNQQFLMEMLHTASVSGSETELQKKVMNYMQPYADCIEHDAMGNVYSILNPNSPMKVLLTGHIDEIGLMVVNFTSQGMLQVIKSGGVRCMNYVGQKVRVLTEKGIVYGAVVNGGSLTKKAPIEESDLLIDIGATSKEEAMSVVSHGDYVILDTDVRELLNRRITARAMDDRIGAFIVIEALIEAKEKGAKVGVYSTTTVGEESSMRGAYAAANHVKPSCAIAVDVTFASDAPLAGDVYGEIELGKGPVLCHSSLLNKKMNDCLIESAKRLNQNIQWEGAGGHTGTDADKMTFTNEGVPCALVSIPLRYMHSPDEVGSLDDIQACIHLLADFIVHLDENTSFDPYD